MKIESVATLKSMLSDSALRGFWPCHEGMGLMVTDISKYGHYGFIKDCNWKKDGKRPFKWNYHKHRDTKTDENGDGDGDEEEKSENAEDGMLSVEELLSRSTSPSPSVGAARSVNGDDMEQKEGVVNGQKYVLQPFDCTTCSKAVFYCNGELLVVAYPSFSFWGKSYRGVAQKFEVTNNCGILTDEIEYDDFNKVLAAAFVGDAKSMWIYNGSSPNASCHSMAAPTDISRWRRRRMKYLKVVDQAQLALTAKQLAAKQYYGLKNIDWFEDEGEDEEVDDDDEMNGHHGVGGYNEVDNGSLTMIKTLANIVIKLDEDSEALRTGIFVHRFCH